MRTAWAWMTGGILRGFSSGGLYCNWQTERVALAYVCHLPLDDGQYGMVSDDVGG